MKLPDANTAALHAHEAQQAREGERQDAYFEKVVESIVEDVCALRKVGNISAAHFMEDVADWVTPDELALIVCMDDSYNELKQSTLAALLVRLETRLKETVREWCEESASGQDLVNERIDALQEDATTKWRDE